MLPFTDPTVVPWAFAIDDRGDLVPVRDLRHNPLTPDPAEGSYGNTSVVFTNRFGKEITILFSRVDEVQCFAEVTLNTTGARGARGGSEHHAAGA